MRCPYDRCRSDGLALQLVNSRAAGCWSKIYEHPSASYAYFAFGFDTEMMMRSTPALLLSLLMAGCGSLPQFEAGWLGRLPTKKLELAVFVFPYDDATMFEASPRVSIRPSEALQIEGEISRQLAAALQRKGLTIGSSLAALRSQHYWLWERAPGSEAGPIAELDRTTPAAFAGLYPYAANRYATSLRKVAASNPGTTFLFICLAGYKVLRDGNSEFRSPVTALGGFGSTKRCGSIGSIAAVDDRLRLLALLDFPAGVGAEEVTYSSNPLSTAFRYRDRTPAEWGDKVSKAVLDAIKANR